MPIDLDSISRMDAKALLQMQLEFSVDQSIGDDPVNRYKLKEGRPRPARPPKSTDLRAESKPADLVGIASRLAAQARNLDELRNSLEKYEHCELKFSARQLVFSDGRADAGLMIIGEAPGRDEDIQGRPFVGRAGRLLDAMFAAIDLSRNSESAANGLYITNVIPWRPPGNRAPTAAEINMMRPFMFAHIRLASPKLIVLMGNIACQAVINTAGITRIRGDWRDFLGIPVMPTFHPAYLLRNPLSKRLAWQDLLAVRLKMRGEEGSS
ncbi:MAG: uracil-DNA glycosylase [Albidovulum sp.]|nr:uracil-DNA glycosylase [Albidovulum sp.]